MARFRTLLNGEAGRIGALIAMLAVFHLTFAAFAPLAAAAPAEAGLSCLHGKNSGTPAPTLPQHHMNACCVTHCAELGAIVLEGVDGCAGPRLAAPDTYEWTGVAAFIAPAPRNPANAPRAPPSLVS
ncbi:hypothetical protein [Methylocystis echinoides]|uniref:hypothetical protein n=1 Tax=Methylocystis echinoides TaxID=29468 RepID=UPI00341712A2